MALCYWVMIAEPCLLGSQTACRMFLGTGGKNSSNMSSAVTKPPSAWLCQSQAQTRWQATGAASSLWQASLFLIVLKSPAHPDLTKGLLLRYLPRFSDSKFQLLWRFIWLCAWTFPFIYLFSTRSNSVCCQSTGGRCRDQVHHSCGEDIYIRADERDFPERLWTFVKTLR